MYVNNVNLVTQTRYLFLDKGQVAANLNQSQDIVFARINSLWNYY